MKLQKKRRKHYNRCPVIKINSDAINIFGVLTDVLILVSIWLTHFWYMGAAK